MGTTTSRLALYKAADDGSEYVDVAVNLNQNFDKIDAAIGFIPATSSTPPTSTFPGMARQDTDTGRTYYRNGADSAWLQMLSASSTYDANIQLVQGRKLGIGKSPGAVIDVDHNSMSVRPEEFRYNSEPYPRAALSWDGIGFGPGSSDLDTAIYRTGVGELLTVGDLSVGGELNVPNQSTFNDVTITGGLDVNVISGDLNVSGDIYNVGVGQALRVWKASPTSKNTTISCTNDPDLVVNLEANATYIVRFVGMAGAATASDIRTLWSVPAGATGLKFCLGPDSLSTSRDQTTMRTGVHVFSSEIIYGISSTTLYSGFIESGIITTGVTGGIFVIAWAQGTSGATDTTLAAGSYMEAIRIA